MKYIRLRRQPHGRGAGERISGSGGCSTIDESSDILVRYGDRQFNESRVYFSDSTYFIIFTLPLIIGNPATALTKPATIVLTQETAVKYFGNEDPIEYTFLDQDFDNLMRADLKLGDLFTLFSMLAIVIACLGLGGLASFVTVQRTK